MDEPSDSSESVAVPGGNGTPDPYLTATVADFLDDLAARTPAPGGGAAASVTCAMAAGLVEMAASFASATGLEHVRERAHELRAARVAPLALGRERVEEHEEAELLVGEQERHAAKVAVGDHAEGLDPLGDDVAERREFSGI